MPKRTAAPAVAYSYIRFSSPEQAAGDSRRRQTEGTARWCKKNNVVLDTSLTMRDLGVSAFRGRHRTGDKHALAGFLKAVEQGRVPRGSYLVVENLDRLSREEERKALRLWMDILDRGINIVTLIPEKVYDHERSDMLDLMTAIIELSRGHSESRAKSERVGDAWVEKKKEARTERTVQTARVPAWLKVVGDRKKTGRVVRGGRFAQVPERVKVVRRMFALANRGYGLALIVKKLTEEGVTPIAGPRNRKDENGNVTGAYQPGWSKAYVRKILAGRAVLGEYQPLRLGQPDGPPIADYYPRVIDEATWNRAQAAMASRKDKPGRVGTKVASLFSGLLWDAQTHSRMLVAHQTRGPKGKRQRARVLVSAPSMEGGVGSVSFPYQPFEEAILSLLREVNPGDIIGEEPEAESVALAAELASIEQRLSAIEEELTGEGDIPALARAARALEEKRQDVLRRLAVARQAESNPGSAAWTEARTLLEAAKGEDARLRLRGVLRTIVEDIWVLVVPRRSHRIAAVQVNFAGGARRDFLVHYWSAGYCREGGWEARSMLAEDLQRVGLLLHGEDLRDETDAEATARYLEAVPLDVVFGAEARG